MTQNTLKMRINIVCAMQMLKFELWSAIVNEIQETFRNTHQNTSQQIIKTVCGNINMKNFKFYI